MDTAIVVFRRDLRVRDNHALAEGARHSRLICVYASEPEGPRPVGAASRAWLHHSLRRLAEELRAQGQRLHFLKGPPAAEIRRLARETGASAVYWNRSYEPERERGERALAEALNDEGIRARDFPGRLFFEPGSITKQEGGGYRVFTPFWRIARAQLAPPPPLPAPRLPPPPGTVESRSLENLGLLDSHPWHDKLWAHWTPGEKAAHETLERFAAELAPEYAKLRDRPDREGTSRLSPYLHFGEITPAQIWAGISAEGLIEGNETFLAELGWREFAYHLLAQFPDLSEKPIDRRFEHFPWAADDGTFARWRQGETGVPIVDAGMRQLWKTGWMHNRIRMVVASFLTKNLRIPWQQGERWFWDTLVDADPANNAMGWQWVQGCGADAAPYYRVFNPVRQAERFDPNGEYIRRWVPELRSLRGADVFAPWKAAASSLRSAGISLGRDYPEPLVDLATSRKAALDAYGAIKGKARE